MRGETVISSLSNKTCTRVSSYFLYFRHFQDKFTILSPHFICYFKEFDNESGVILTRFL